VSGLHGLQRLGEMSREQDMPVRKLTSDRLTTKCFNVYRLTLHAAKRQSRPDVSGENSRRRSPRGPQTHGLLSCHRRTPATPFEIISSVRGSLQDARPCAPCYISWPCESLAL
jgi:hypothetical protein